MVCPGVAGQLLRKLLYCKRMKIEPAKESNKMAWLRDKAIIVAAGVTIIGTVYWLKQSEEVRQLAAATSDEQQKMRAALERLATTIERIEVQMQTLVAAQSSTVASAAPAKKPSSAASKRAALASGGTAPAQPVRRRQASSPKTTRSRNGNAASAGQATEGTGTDQAVKEAE